MVSLKFEGGGGGGGLLSVCLEWSGGMPRPQEILRGGTWPRGFNYPARPPPPLNAALAQT